jgi:antirestriction protein ArdC
MCNVYHIVLEKIVNKLKEGTIPWRQPWRSGTPKNYATGRAYSGLNVILLGMLDYASPWFLTWNQLRKLDAFPRRGCNSNLVVFYKPEEFWDEEKDPDTGRTKKVLKTKYILRFYNVYNIEDTTLPVPEKDKFNQLERCEEIITNIPDKPPVQHEYSQAYYNRKLDLINMPHKELFHKTEGYYATLFHELIHSTGHKSRLDRQTLYQSHAFGDEIYTQEELIAELGSSFLCAHAGISNETLEYSASYIDGWLNAINSNPRLLFDCSKRAKEAAAYIVPEEEKRAA